MRYSVQWDYASSMGGPWKKGQPVELDPAEAAVINRDSPGVLVEDKPAQRAPKAAPKDRQVKAASSRAEKDNG